MPYHPVHICIQQSESPFASWSPCSAASAVPGAQSVLLHLMHGISKVPNSYLCWCTEVLQY